MELKINKQFNLKIISVFLALFIAIIPFFQPKKAEASIALLVGITGLITTGIIAAGYARDTILTPEQINNANDYMTANLQTAFPDPAEYNKQMGILQNLDNDIRAGKDIDWSKYSGKALYAVLKGVVDVVWPLNEDVINIDNYTFIGKVNNYSYYKLVNSEYSFRFSGNWKDLSPSHLYQTYVEGSINSSRYEDRFFKSVDNINNKSEYWKYQESYLKGDVPGVKPGLFGYVYYYNSSAFKSFMTLFGYGEKNQNGQYVPNMTTKTANKVKLPTRLPQTVINNITNYIDGSSENLIVNPTADELPQLPDNYNPTTDELPDLPGYVDVTPDQEPTTDPEPTPTPPEPTPTPPEYDGSGWVNPIGNFLAGLLEFLKTAFVPTQSLDFSPLQNMESGTFGAKFPFSLPSDFGKILGVLQAEPITPKFDASIPLSKVGYQDIPMEIDLEPYSNIAGICKSGFVILFCIGLFFLTRRFMSPGG